MDIAVIALQEDLTVQPHTSSYTGDQHYEFPMATAMLPASLQCEFMEQNILDPVCSNLDQTGDR